MQLCFGANSKHQKPVQPKPKPTPLKDIHFDGPPIRPPERWLDPMLCAPPCLANCLPKRGTVMTPNPFYGMYHYVPHFRSGFY
ncbi:hypothetical protein DdX_04212 [Ditylenchus destructor]|uniref:Uncharacterized protein n=1 Tax=Ditylenchus destructor TaxID=166010 RepID=A0AAD4NAQ9_9BILA|nr:hypothetical protein DdX_04212 [Ditylenchus destructor]